MTNTELLHLDSQDGCVGLGENGKIYSMKSFRYTRSVNSKDPLYILMDVLRNTVCATWKYY